VRHDQDIENSSIMGMRWLSVSIQECGNIARACLAILVIRTYTLVYQTYRNITSTICIAPFLALVPYRSSFHPPDQSILHMFRPTLEFSQAHPQPTRSHTSLPHVKHSNACVTRSQGVNVAQHRPTYPSINSVQPHPSRSCSMCQNNQ
jgi:hypothetical protein